MPLFKPKAKRDAATDPSDSSPQSLALAYDVQRRTARKRKMAVGGMVEPMAPEARPSSIAEAVMRKRKAMAEGGMVEPDNKEDSVDPSPFDELNEEAAMKELYEDDQLMADPLDSNEHGDDIESDARDMVSAIRKKMMAKRGF